ncbi:hypothetical protein [Streptomyces coeruleofuscus]|uniref:Amidase n=1 Tax=Streptomyces coeruleofuscus TaxID=66879 RepID=A0ABP5WAA5_9ACTN
MRGTLTSEQALRWSEGGARTTTLGVLADRIAAVETAINRAADPRNLMADPLARHAVRPPGPANGEQ